MEHTTGDFLKMIWQENCYIIIMLAEEDNDDQYICYNYWINSEDFEIVFGGLMIKKVQIFKETSFVRTILRITDMTSHTSREIHHFQYTRWKSNSVPAKFSDMIKLLNEIERVKKFTAETEKLFSRSPLGPMVVHCSSGIDRTGTFCTFYNALDQMCKTEKISLTTILLNIRSQRYLSLPCLEQYIFCYNFLVYFAQLITRDLKEYKSCNLELQSRKIQKNKKITL